MRGTPRPSFVLSLFERLFDVKPREFLRVQTFFLFLTTLSVFYTMGASAGDTLFLSRFGSKEAERLLPWVYIGTGLLTVALTWLYERVAERFPREKFVVGVNLALAVSLLAFRLALRGGQLWLYYALVVWIEACALVALMLFFSFAGDYFTSRDARRLYGYINGGIAVGSIAGGIAVDRLVRLVGDDNLLYVCAGLLAAAALWCLVIPLVAEAVEDAEESEEDEGVPLSAVLADRYLRIVLVLVLASQACGWLVDYQLKIVASRELQEEALAAFFGRFYGLLGAAQLAIQFVLVGWLLRRFGLVKSLVVLPALLLLSSGAFYAHPVFLAAIAGNFLRLAFLETLDEPAQELLFLPLPARLRVRAQSFIEGMVLPLGICLAGALLLAFGSALGDVRRISILGISLALAWLGAVALLLPRYREALAGSLRRLGLDAADLSSALASAEGERVVADLLRSGRPEQQSLALDAWKGRPLGRLAEPVRRLIGSPDEAVAVKAVEAVAADRDAERLPALAPALRDPRGPVRAAAISACFDVDPASALRELPRWSEDADPDVRVAALAGTLSRGGRAGAAAGLARLASLIESEDASARAIAAKALARAAGRRTNRLFRRLLDDPSLAVRREVALACAAAPDPELAPWLVAQLKDPALRPLACEALEGMPLSAVPAFVEALAQRERPQEERALLLRVLGRFGGLRGAKALWEVLASDEDVALRAAAAESLVYMRSKNKAHDLGRHQDAAFLSRRLDELALIERARAEVGAADPFFCAALFDYARLETKCVLFALALMHGEPRAEQIEASLFGGTAAQKANALEIVEVVFPRETASRLVAAVGPLVTETPAGGGGLERATIERLRRLPPWLRVAARRHLDARGIGPGAEERMSGQEKYMYRLMSEVSFLKETRLFQDVSANELTSLAKILQERTFCKGEVLFSQGQKADCFYLVREGALKLAVAGAEVARLGPRECVGEMALIEGQPYSATASADGDLRVLRVSAEDFHNVLLTHPEIAVALLRRMSAQLRQALARPAA